MPHDFFLIPTISNCKRDLRDKFKPNKRATDLTRIFESLNFFNLNGRAPGDTPADFKYIGARGSSVIDLVWFDLQIYQFLSEFYLDYDIVLSNHFPVVISVKFPDASGPESNSENMSRTDFHFGNLKIILHTLTFFIRSPTNQKSSKAFLRTTCRSC